MGEWKEQPYEVVLRIAEIMFCGNFAWYWNLRRKWMFVNKQLYEMWLSHNFMEIEISLNPKRDKMFNALVKLPTSLRRRVKKIHGNELAVPKEVYLDYSDDPQYLLMKYCPSVESFDFSL